MTAHEFRASFSTLANESGLWNPDAIEAALAHVERNEVRKAYNRGLYWEERIRLADWWAMRDMFGTEDFVWLSIGLQPSKELKKYFEKFPTHQPRLDSILKKEADLRFKLMITARNFQPNYQYIRADVAHEWLQKVELQVPKGLKDALELAWDRKNGVKRPSKDASVNEKAKRDARERKSLLKLVIGMAIAGYKYHPSQDRNNVGADIEDDLANLGIGLNQKTIRKHLQKGVELLPDDALQE